MRASVIEAGEVALQPGAHRQHGPVGAEIHVLVFHGVRASLDEHGVQPAAAAIQADLDLMAAQDLEKRVAGELGALIRV